MINLTMNQFVILACLADYNLTGYEIYQFASELSYDIPLEELYPTITELEQWGFIEQYKQINSGTIMLNPVILLSTQKVYQITANGASLLIAEMEKVDLLIKRIRKEVRKIK